MSDPSRASSRASVNTKSDEHYQKKYLKYKSKYIETKKKSENVNFNNNQASL